MERHPSQVHPLPPQPVVKPLLLSSSLLHGRPNQRHYRCSDLLRQVSPHLYDGPQIGVILLPVHTYSTLLVQCSVRFVLQVCVILCAFNVANSLLCLDL
jgi:hypothetical protein